MRSARPQSQLILVPCKWQICAAQTCSFPRETRNLGCLCEHTSFYMLATNPWLGEPLPWAEGAPLCPGLRGGVNVRVTAELVRCVCSEPPGASACGMQVGAVLPPTARVPRRPLRWVWALPWLVNALRGPCPGGGHSPDGEAWHTGVLGRAWGRGPEPGASSRGPDLQLPLQTRLPWR